MKVRTQEKAEAGSFDEVAYLSYDCPITVLSFLGTHYHIEAEDRTRS
jgi:hypothetical protein